MFGLIFEIWLWVLGFAVSCVGGLVVFGWGWVVWGFVL